MARTTDMLHASPAMHGTRERGTPSLHHHTHRDRRDGPPEATVTHPANGGPGPGPEEQSGRDPAHGRSVYNLWIFGLLDRHPVDHG
jgi:hypothetical protein